MKSVKTNTPGSGNYSAHHRTDTEGDGALTEDTLHTTQGRGTTSHIKAYHRPMALLPGVALLLKNEYN